MLSKYRIYHGLIDIVGVIGIAMALGYVFFSDNFELSSKAMDIWSGLSTELLGAWAAARVVEYAIRKNGEYDKIRIRLARNLRYYLNIASRIIEFNHRPDVSLVQRELKWTQGFYKKNKKCFSQDEILDLDNAYSALATLIHSLSIQDKPKEELYERLTAYENLAFKAECNIFEETPEIP